MSVIHRSPIPTMLPVGTIDRIIAHEIDRQVAPLIVLEAPAGYGKSTLLVQVRNMHLAKAQDVVWLSLDDTSENEITFLATLIRAMMHIRLDLGILQDQAARDFAGISVKQVVAQIVDTIASSGREISFFIDNLDETTDAVVPIVATLASRLANRCRFFVATRYRARSGLAAMKAAGLAVVFSAADLRFTREEGRAFFRQHANIADSDAIIDRVEGWPVMIQLIKLSMGRAGSEFLRIPEDGSMDGDLAEYLAEQVLQGLPIETQKDLMYLSVCERFNGDTLNALRGRKDGWSAIADYVHKGLLIVPLDGVSIWHRFHPIFSEFLRTRLKREDVDATRRIHREAADWFAGQGLVNDAVRHANAAGDIQLTTRLLAEAGGWLITFRGGTKALRIIANLPEDVLEGHPYLRLGQIYLMAQESQLKMARASFNQLMARVRTGSCFPSQQDEHLFDVSAGVLDALLCVYEVKRVDPRRLLSLQSQCGPGIPDQLSAMITHLLGFAYYCDGNYIQARRVCPTAAEQCEAAGAAFVAVYSYLALGDTYLEMGELDRAEHCFNVASTVARKNFGPDSNQVTAANIFLAEVAYERNDIELAGSLIKRALVGIEHRDPWSSVYMSGHRVAAELAEREKGWGAGIEFLQRALGRLENHELKSVYAPYLHVKMSEIYASVGLLGSAYEALMDDNLQPENREQQRSRSDLLRMLATMRLTLIQGGGDVVLRQLDRVMPSLRTRNQKRRILKVHVLKACALFQQKRFEEADREIAHAVQMAVATGMVAPLFEERSLLEPLMNARGLASDQLSSIGLGASTDRLAQFVILDHSQCDMIEDMSPDFGLDFEDADRPRLSRREREVLLLLADGLSGKEIANEINLSLNTIMGYRKSLYRKLDTTSRSGAIATGRQLGYLQQ